MSQSILWVPISLYMCASLINIDVQKCNSIIATGKCHFYKIPITVQITILASIVYLSQDLYISIYFDHLSLLYSFGKPWVLTIK